MSRVEDPIRLAVLVGSVRPGRFAPVVAGWFVGRAKQRQDLVLDVVDLADHENPAERLAGAVGAADAVVVLTPEYNHSFPGPLKTAIDSVHAQWRAKPVGLVSYGGISGGLRAAEALRLVFAELNATTIRETISFAFAHGAFDDDGEPRDAGAVHGASDRFLDQLAWWAHTLRAGRATRPFPA
jgi:NAD(P)H-dependent FMN reductase